MSTVLDSDNSHGYCANPSTGAGTWPTIDQQSGAMGTNTACVEYPSLITDQLEAKSLTWK